MGARKDFYLVAVVADRKSEPGLMGEGERKMPGHEEKDTEQTRDTRWTLSILLLCLYALQYMYGTKTAARAIFQGF